MLRTANLVFHTLAFGHHAFTLKYLVANLDYTKTEDPRVKEMEDFGPRYITTWNLIIQTIYLFLAIYTDITDFTSTKQAKFALLVRKYKGYLYTVIMFPTTLFVAMMFWTLFWINREWVLPINADVVAPAWLNHSIHTNILLVLFGELFLAKKGLPKPEFRTAVNILSLFGVVYFFQFFLTYVQMGRWIYGVFYDLTWTGRIGMVVLNYVISLMFLKLGFVIQSFKNGSKKTN